MEATRGRIHSQEALEREEKRRTEWRLFRTWSEEELQDRLETLKKSPLNFPMSGPESQEGTNWRRYYSESVIGHEAPGEIAVDGVFQRVWKAISHYQFSDPDIVEGHFDPKDAFKNRSILLEIKILGLRYLCGVRVGAIKQEILPEKTVYGFRYDTLVGHMETGSEWFLLTKIHATGEIWFRISASWRPGVFPNWWSRLGFYLFSQRYQLAWHRLAYLRLREVAGARDLKLAPVPYGKRLVHTGPEITNSDLWKLEKPSAVQKVLEVGQEKKDWKKLDPDLKKKDDENHE